MEIRLQYTNYEYNEYKFVGMRNLAETLQIFAQFPWLKELEKIDKIKGTVTFPAIKILNSRNEYIIFNAFYQSNNILFNLKIKYKSNLFFRTMKGLKYNSKKCEHIIEDFFNKSISNIVSQIMSGKYLESPFLIDLLTYNVGDKDKLVELEPDEDKYYKYMLSWKKVILKTLPSFVFLAIPLIISLLTGNFNGFVFIQTICALLALPGIIIIINYLLFNKHLKIYFKKNENRFIISNNGLKKTLDKNFISEIIYKENISRNMPWYFLYYHIIVFNNHERLFLTNLVINELDIFNHLGHLNIKKEKYFFPLIKNS